MSDLQQLWRLTWIGELGRHLALEITSRLPDDNELMAGPRELSVVTRRDGVPLGFATTFGLPVPGEESVLDARLVSYVIRDLQDEIAIHLGRAWPVGGSGAALTATAAESPDGIALSFVSRVGDEEIRHAPFRPPPGLEEARTTA